MNPGYSSIFNGLVVLNPHKETGHTAKTFFPVSKKEIGWAFLN